MQYKDLSKLLSSNRIIYLSGLCLILGAFGVAGCQSADEPAQTQATPIPDAKGGVSFQELTSSPSAEAGRFHSLSGPETGLEFTNELMPPNMRKYLLNGAGLATGDFDNDGLVDVYAISQDGSNRLFRQTAHWPKGRRAVRPFGRSF